MLIQKYSAALIEPVLTLLADAFLSNPLHTSCFGPAALEQNRLFFRIGLHDMFTGNALVAVCDGEIHGYIHFKAFPQCLPSAEEIPLAVAALFRPVSESIPKIVQWFSRWCHLDPGRPHVHLGPLGVSPEAQRSGIGTALMNRYIDHLIKENTAGYLETDRAENVAFYKKFGFVVMAEDSVIGVPVWYMWRDQGS
jgi:GNAT superfamily N-acetyltransferase